MTKRAAITLVIGLSLAVFCSYCALEAKKLETLSEAPVGLSDPRAQGLLVIRIAGLTSEILATNPFGDLFEELEKRGRRSALQLGNSPPDSLGFGLDLGTNPGTRFNALNRRFDWQGESLSSLAQRAHLETHSNLAPFSIRNAKPPSSYPPSPWARDTDLNPSDQALIRQAHGFLSQHRWRFLSLKLTSGAVTSSTSMPLREDSTRHLSPRGRSLQSVLLVARGLIELAGSNAAICLIAESKTYPPIIVMAGEGTESATNNWQPEIAPRQVHQAWAHILGLRSTNLSQLKAPSLGPSPKTYQLAAILIVALSIMMGFWSWAFSRRSHAS